MTDRRGSAFATVAVFGPMLAAAVLLPEIRQSAGYHDFADQRAILRIPNFWNVVSNLPFLAVAIWGLRAFRSKAAFTKAWERAAYAVVLTGTALTAFGSAYYHWAPDDATLFWDRLPMAPIFMGLFAGVLGNRRLLAPLVAAGICSVLWWRWSGDLRAYVVVQFVPLLTIPLLLVLRRPRYTSTGWMWAMIGLYVLAKLLELGDRALGGGHAWKHLAAAAAMVCYCSYVSRRLPYRSIDNTSPPSV